MNPSDKADTLRIFPVGSGKTQSGGYFTDFRLGKASYWKKSKVKLFLAKLAEEIALVLVVILTAKKSVNLITSGFNDFLTAIVAGCNKITSQLSCFIGKRVEFYLPVA